MLRSILFFIIAAVSEIGGAYMIWQWQRAGKPWFFGALGLAALFAYAFIQTAQTFSFGRAFAAYGGIFIVTATLWGWWIDGHAPDRWDWLGAAVCLAGAAIILWMPRK